jgi:SAM-dependent methyltransferase
LGLDISAVRFLAAARKYGVSFDTTLMLGRQGLFVESNVVRSILHDRVVRHSGFQVANDGFAEPLLYALGARTVDALDFSPYQGASIVHDLNQPIPQNLHRRFSTVLDAGTLEHVFNFPQAIKNCMEMVAPGGHLLIVTPANNFFGHGFYQFSPELFYRVLSPTNGFSVTRMVAFEEDWADLRYFEVSDPDSVRKRVTLVNSFPTYLMIAAKRTAIVPILAQPPQQSDYTVMWSEFGPGERGATAASDAIAQTTRPELFARMRERLSSLVPLSAKRWYRSRRRGPLPYNPEFFRETDL